MGDLEIKILPHGNNEELLPRYASKGAAGLDIAAAVPKDAPIKIPPGERALVPSGFSLAIPAGFEAQIRPRSGLALKKGLTVANAPGTIDSDYRGEVKVLLINLGNEAVVIERGERIAQMVIAPVTTAKLNEVEDLPPSARGDKGFGSTGMTESED